MADTISTPGGMEMALKDNGLLMDMTQLAAHTLRSLKESSSDEQPAPDTLPTTVAGTTGSSSMSPTNMTTPPPSMTTFRCERCENFETNSRASLLLHVVQCLSGPPRLKAEEPEHDSLNMSVHVTQQQHADQQQHSGSGGLGKLSAETHPPNSIAPSMAANGSASSPAPSSSSSPSSSRKVFECDVCNMKFSNGANMRRHKMRHTGVKPYECRVCQKRFFRKDHLAEHFTTHTKTLPYHCPICNRGFQRQIAMRAHFQNEHVGQHDLVKTCPLCSYRAGSMKSLRIHFFNRHGIDLDNPGPGGTSSLLLALESQASQVAAAAAAAGFVPGLSAVAAAAAAAANANAAAVNAANMQPPSSHQSDSGESLRSMENATPPMHFLTPHVEISTLSDSGAELYNGNSGAGVGDARDVSGNKERDSMVVSPAPHPIPPQEHPMDCNAKSSLPSSTSSIGAQLSASPKMHHHHDNHITPSISLIPIKQEPPSEDLSTDLSRSGQKNNGGITVDQMNGGDSSESEYNSGNSRLTSLIKVSPLKSLLREDLKRRICAKANNRITRNAAALENNNIISVTATPTTPNSSTCNSTPICNGTITSSGQETEATLLNRKQILTCHFCGIEFPDETLYFLHKGCHCESNPWKCNICGEQCNNVYEFNSHLLSKSHQ